jgi:hypothetical protein
MGSSGSNGGGLHIDVLQGSAAMICSATMAEVCSVATAGSICDSKASSPPPPLKCAPAQLLQGIWRRSPSCLGANCVLQNGRTMGPFLQTDFGFSGRGSLQNIVPSLDLKWTYQIVRKQEQERSGSTRYFTFSVTLDKERPYKKQQKSNQYFL